MPNSLGLLDFEWDAPLSDEDRDRMLDKMVAAIHKWRLEVPAILFLETSAPLSNIGGQSLVAFSPFIAPLLRGGIRDVQRLSRLLANPENVRRLIDLLSDSAEEKDPKKGPNKPNAARE
ncbi:MAG: hypothetical protein M3Y13_15645 [Armatimonadota bacterium]|nr:hypothetical protein [Armatimonadota bacterium]